MLETTQNHSAHNEPTYSNAYIHTFFDKKMYNDAEWLLQIHYPCNFNHFNSLVKCKWTLIQFYYCTILFCIILLQLL